MANTFTNFVLKLAEDPAEVKRLLDNFDLVTAQYGLSEADKSLLLSNNIVAVRDAVYTDLQSQKLLPEIIIVVLIVNVKTHVQHEDLQRNVSERFEALLRRYR